MKIRELYGAAKADDISGFSARVDLMIHIRKHLPALIEVVEAARQAYEYGFDRRKLDKALSKLPDEWK
jgi:uncharacterized protein YabN with tetrapyrrole methylase and pyrophosphatase domain